MNYCVDQFGYYGEFGGAFVPEMLRANLQQLVSSYKDILESKIFQNEYQDLLRNYVGRPTALTLAKNLSDLYKCKIYLKREDLNHTGSHKINNALGQALIAMKLGKRRIIAETGAGQHGVATATVCALFGLSCTIYMGALDMQRQAPNVLRMQMLGAKVVAVESGSKTLKDATNQAIADWINNVEDTHYIIGSVVGPHPYPDLVARLQAIIGQEIGRQLIEFEGRSYPDLIIACVGGGSNSIGSFYNFLDQDNTKLIAVEAAGHGIETELTAAAIATGKVGILHGSKTLVMQNADGQIQQAECISAGLDYPAIGPQHAYLNKIGRVVYGSVNDQEALTAAMLLAKVEGIIPALESAHALAYLPKLNLKTSDLVVVTISGRGDKDLATYQQFFK